QLDDPRHILDAVRVRHGYQLPDDVALLLIAAPAPTTATVEQDSRERARNGVSAVPGPLGADGGG
ncbi:MAG: hypothetical protein ACRCY8_17015, partial [Dermatophilaceae bacterium]